MDSETALLDTSLLLNQLDNIIDQSSVMREIVNCRERLHRLERAAGACHQAKIMRCEIEAMELELESARSCKSEMTTTG